jgi:preprotein translocase subunit SecE
VGIIDYIKSTKGELKHVSWPTKKQITVFTATVILVSVATALFLGVFDFVFSGVLRYMIESSGTIVPVTKTMPTEELNTGSLRSPKTGDKMSDPSDFERELDAGVSNEEKGQPETFTGENN